MTGSIQPKNGRLYMVIYSKDVTGEDIRKWYKTGLPEKGNKKKAEAMLEKWLREHQDCDISRGDLLFADYLEEWLERTKPTLEPSTIRGYNEKLKNYIFPYFRQRKIKLINLKVRDLEPFYFQHLTVDKNLSAQSVLHCHRIISKALNDAIRWELIPSNPALLARHPKVSKPNTQYLNLAQIKQLIELFKDTKIEHIVKLTALYGLRRSEVLGLCWDMVDFENNQFTIGRAQIYDGHKDYLKNSAKNKSSYRTLPMTSDVKEMFLFLKQRQQVLKEFYCDHGYVFAWEDGTPFSTNYVSKSFGKIIKKSSLPKIRFHDLRHSSATNLLAKDFSLVDIQHWLGHSQPSTTLNFYSHVDSSSKNHIKNFYEQEFDFGEILEKF